MMKVQAVLIDTYCLLTVHKPKNIKQLLREHKYHLKPNKQDELKQQDVCYKAVFPIP